MREMIEYNEKCLFVRKWIKSGFQIIRRKAE